MSRIGIIGGSGLYPPSDSYIMGELEGREVVFLPRHGKGHRITPTELNNKANIYGMKKLDVSWIISVSAVGSLRPELKPQDVVIIDQFFDRTNQARNNTFFGEGIVAHIQFAKPLCPSLSDILYNAGKECQASIHLGSTYINIEGPAFSTLAESQTYRKWGMDVVGMTQMTEAKLAREAEICYSTLAMITDYDCWYEEETVSAEMILENLHKNVETARNIISHAIKSIPEAHECECSNALANSLVTDKSLWPQETVKKLGPIIQKYL